MKHETAVMEEAMSLRTGAYWMPFTHNRYLKKNPRSRILARAEGAYYTTAEGARLFDCVSGMWRSEEHTSELQSRLHLVCRLLLEKKKKKKDSRYAYAIRSRRTHTQYSTAISCRQCV